MKIKLDQTGRMRAAFELYYVLLFFALSIAIIVIGLLQPLMADDFIYSNLVKSNAGLLKFLSSLYQQWTGRLQGAFLLWLELRNAWPGLIIKGLHGLVLLGTCFLSLAMGLGRWPQIFKRDCLSFLLSVILFWFGLPFLGEVAFWSSGAAFYLFPMFFGLLFLIPYRFHLENMCGSNQLRRSGRFRIGLNLVMLLLGVWVGLG